MTQEEKQTEPESKEPIKVAFSWPQLAGGALAAVTAAAIGSRLGVGGTLIGAAVASIIGGVGGTLYSAGIDRTHRKVAGAISRGYERVRTSAEYDRDAPHSLAGDEASPTLPGLDPEPGAEAAEPTLIDAAHTGRSEASRRKLWKVMGLSVAAMFLAALVAITVVELGLGRTLDGGEGTTISQVVRERKSTPTPTPKPSPSVTTTTPTMTPTPSVSDQPTTPAPTITQPTETAVPSATVTVTTEPTAATTP
ncbi:MAG TPA: hypothetical protein VFW55_04240 [Propionicimonas sp.]|nr:hypothetical protein [Propionicimonas sp.]